MPPKTKFTKEAIINTAFEIAKTEGLDSITVRKVADKLGSSIAPIYVNFTEVEELKQEVLAKVHDIAQQMLMTQYSTNQFLNIGISGIKFAREYSVLFKDLIFNSSRYLKKVNPSRTNIMDQMKQSSTLSGFTNEELGEILFKMQVFQLGLSIMDVNGMLPEHFDEETIIKVLESAGQDVISSARLRQNEKE
ncbi:TetR/AcrR family transcriptional regulator [Pseudoneobacillus sp. C159]